MSLHNQNLAKNSSAITAADAGIITITTLVNSIASPVHSITLPETPHHYHHGYRIEGFPQFQSQKQKEQRQRQKQKQKQRHRLNPTRGHSVDSNGAGDHCGVEAVRRGVENQYHPQFGRKTKDHHALGFVPQKDMEEEDSYASAVEVASSSDNLMQPHQRQTHDAPSSCSNSTTAKQHSLPPHLPPLPPPPPPPIPHQQPPQQHRQQQQQQQDHTRKSLSKELAPSLEPARPGFPATLFTMADSSSAAALLDPLYAIIPVADSGVHTQFKTRHHPQLTQQDHTDARQSKKPTQTTSTTAEAAGLNDSPYLNGVTETYTLLGYSIQSTGIPTPSRSNGFPIASSGQAKLNDYTDDGSQSATTAGIGRGGGEGGGGGGGIGGGGGGGGGRGHKVVHIAVPVAVVFTFFLALLIVIYLCQRHKRRNHGHPRVANSSCTGSASALGSAVSTTDSNANNADIEHGPRGPKGKYTVSSHLPVSVAMILASVYSSIQSYFGGSRGSGGAGDASSGSGGGSGYNDHPPTGEGGASHWRPAVGRAVQKCADWKSLAGSWLASSGRQEQELSAAERLRKISETNKALRKRDLATKYTHDRTIASQYFGWLPGVAKLRPARLGGWAKIGRAGIHLHSLPDFQNMRPFSGMPDDAAVGSVGSAGNRDAVGGIPSGIDIACTRMLPEEHVAEYRRIQLADDKKAGEAVESPEAVEGPMEGDRGERGVLPEDFPHVPGGRHQVPSAPLLPSRVV